MSKNASLMRNTDGSIYHLHLHPGQLAETVILVGDPQRSHLIASYFDRIEFSAEHREFVTFTGTLKGKRLSVLSTGVGAGGIDVVINEVDALFNMDLDTCQPKDSFTQLQFIRFGTTGALQADLPVGSLVTSAYAFSTDAILQYYPRHRCAEVTELEASLQQYFTRLPMAQGIYAAAADPELMQWFAPVVTTAGITFTCNGFYAPQGRVLRQVLPYPDFIEWVSDFEFAGYKTTNLEMETAVIYGLCESLGHKGCSISTVMANRRDDSIGTYNVAVEGMLHTLLDRLVEKVE